MGSGWSTDWFDSETGTGCETVPDPDRASGGNPMLDNRKQRREMKMGVNRTDGSDNGPRLCIDLLKKEDGKLFSDVGHLVKDSTKSAREISLTALAIPR